MIPQFHKLIFSSFEYTSYPTYKATLHLPYLFSCLLLQSITWNKSRRTITWHEQAGMEIRAPQEIIPGKVWFATTPRATRIRGLSQCKNITRNYIIYIFRSKHHNYFFPLKCKASTPNNLTLHKSSLLVYMCSWYVPIFLFIYITMEKLSHMSYS
jgi:hypothetical protein